MVSDRPLGHHHPSRARARGDHGRPLAHCRDAGLSKSDREQLVRAGAYTVLWQVLEIGFFHADPHPGNLFRWRMAGCASSTVDGARVDEQTTSELAMLTVGVATSDIDKVYAAFIARATWTSRRRTSARSAVIYRT